PRKGPFSLFCLREATLGRWEFRVEDQMARSAGLTDCPTTSPLLPILARVIARPLGMCEQDAGVAHADRIRVSTRRGFADFVEALVRLGAQRFVLLVGREAEQRGPELDDIRGALAAEHAADRIRLAHVVDGAPPAPAHAEYPAEPAPFRN